MNEHSELWVVGIGDDVGDGGAREGKDGGEKEDSKRVAAGKEKLSTGMTTL